MKQTNLVKKGFTLVEVVIVLAIAALIMVVVFFAVTGAQRAQRNQTRKDVANRVKAAMTAARGNNNGQVVIDDVLRTYVPAVERNNMDIGTGAIYPAGCDAAGAAVTVQWDPNNVSDTASVCLEDGITYTTP